MNSEENIVNDNSDISLHIIKSSDLMINTPMRKEDIPELEWWKYGLMYILATIILIGMIFLTIFKEEVNLDIIGEASSSSDSGFPEPLQQNERLLLKKGYFFIGLIFLYWFNGYFFMRKLEWRINYTRKINHFTSWLLPPIIDILVNVEETTISILWNIIIVLIGFVLFTSPIRKRVPLIDTIFDTLDRPEDRPNTLIWLFTQGIAVALFLIPLGILLSRWNFTNIIFIPLMAITLGDGLAEPIGIKFGKHKYKVRAWCSTKEYTRSLEGSSVVFITAFITVCALYTNFTNWEFILNLLVTPLALTLTEAFSPHTWDNPFLILVGGGIPCLIHLFLVRLS